MKAVLMNSAEKVQGRIGMSRTILKTNGLDTWDQSESRDDPGNPRGRHLSYDREMGTGFLNARRALTQLRGGQFGPLNANTRPVGWNYQSIDGQDAIQKYTLPSLRAGTWISMTLTWDRLVFLQDNVVANRLYDVGETFESPLLANLDRWK